MVTSGIHYMYDVRPTADGGFITTGEATEGLNDPYPGLTAIGGFKTDSLGCVVPGCQYVGVQEYLLDLNEHLNVSPNPASENVHVQLHLPEGFEPEGKVRVLLMDTQGRIVHEQQATRNLDRMTSDVDVRSLATGTYFVHLADAKRWLAGSKVVVE